jgi:hypothetical protein
VREQTSSARSAEEELPQMSTDDLTGLVLGLKLETEFAQDGSTVHTIPQEETSESLIERWVPDESPTLGQKGGSSGVWLERCDKNGTRKRVVKEIGKFFDGQVRIDYARELEALGLISSSKVSTTPQEACEQFVNKRTFPNVAYSLQTFLLESLGGSKIKNLSLSPWNTSNLVTSVVTCPLLSLSIKRIRSSRNCCRLWNSYTAICLLTRTCLHQ